MGSAGKAYSSDLVRMLAEKGFRSRRMPTNKDKVTRFGAFSAAAEAGLVRVVRGEWNNAYFAELETFTGNGKAKDDQVDGTSDAFIRLSEDKVYKIPNMSGINAFRRDNPFAVER